MYFKTEHISSSVHRHYIEIKFFAESPLLSHLELMKIPLELLNNWNTKSNQSVKNYPGYSNPKSN